MVVEQIVPHFNRRNNLQCIKPYHHTEQDENRWDELYRSDYRERDRKRDGQTDRQVLSECNQILSTLHIIVSKIQDQQEQTYTFTLSS